MVTEKLGELARRRRAAHMRFTALGSKTYEAFVALEKATYSDGALPKRQKELIAIGISIVLDCESCIQWHIEQAARAGASGREIMEAIDVGMEMGGGPATVSARFALEVMDAVFPGGI